MSVTKVDYTKLICRFQRHQDSDECGSTTHSPDAHCGVRIRSWYCDEIGCMVRHCVVCGGADCVEHASYCDLDLEQGCVDLTHYFCRVCWKYDCDCDKDCCCICDHPLGWMEDEVTGESPCTHGWSTIRCCEQVDDHDDRYRSTTDCDMEFERLPDGSIPKCRGDHDTSGFDHYQWSTFC
jgi:hypothetical protein